MRVGIDARILYYTRGGIARYGRGLIQSLAAIEDRPELTLFFARKEGGEPPLNGAAGVRSRRLLTPPHSLFEEPMLGLELIRAELDVLHGMDFFVPTSSRVPQVLTIHDLYFLHDPRILDPRSYRHYKKILDYIPKAAHVICDSEATRRDVERFSRCDTKKCSVVYPGIDVAWWAKNDSPSPDLSAGHFLIVSTLEPRKNIPVTLDAYRIAREHLGSATPPLIIAGRKGHRAEEIFEAIERLNLDDCVRYVGEPDDAVLRGLYHSASALLTFSTFEGFGFPALEAMACGLPVLSSTGSAVEEFAKDAVLLANPESPEEMAAAMVVIAEDSKLREVLSAKGRACAQELSWDRAAARVCDIYRTL